MPIRSHRVISCPFVAKNSEARNDPRLRPILRLSGSEMLQAKTEIAAQPN